MIRKELLLASWLEKLQKKWDSEEYYYDVEEATKVFKFVSKLTNDRGASRQFELLEFQFEIITEILCVKRRSDGKRKHREAHINIPRKNGKSFLAAIIVVYLFFCQRHIFGALFILTANTTKQAGELYATVEHFIKTNKTLRRYCKITSSTKTIVRKDNGNKLMVLSSDADNADSFNDYVAVLDEIHQAKNDEMYGKLRTGQGAWDEPLIMTITTASSGEDPANPEMQLYTMAKKIEAGEVALIFSWNEKPTEVFTYIIPTAGGVFGAAVIWYLKAVQLENGIKIQLGMIKKLIDLGEENPAEEIKERTIQKMKDKTEALIDEALEPTEIQNF